MTGLKIKEWMRELLSKAKAAATAVRIRFPSLTGAMKSIVGRLRITGNPVTQWKTSTLTLLRTHRLRILSGLGAIGILLAGSFGYQQYMKANTFEVYHVYVKDQKVGTVSDPQIVDDFKIRKVKETEEKNPNIHMVLNTDEIVLKGERAYKAKSNDTAALEQLDRMMVAHAVGVELAVDGNVIGFVKDQDTADQILNKIKEKYTGFAQEKGKVSILSAEKNLAPGESEIQKVDFVQKVDLNVKDIDPSQLMNPEDVLKKLETGDVQPTKYTVEKGDCVSCIAKKFGISKQVIYENNPWIVEDMIKVGQQLDLTVLQPTLSVKTVEKLVERQEIQYETEYVKDDTMRAGIIKTITPGKNGLKDVTFLVTKVNGKMMDEEMLNEVILEEPVKAVAKKGTKVILGEGTGKFSWPVVSSRISSGYGNRWGRLHKGVDLTGSKSIIASDNGKVEYAGYKDDYGYHIIINHLNGFKTLYGHLSKMDVKAGQIVEKGEKIGTMGNTGDSTGTHLHFEILKNGSPENPLKYLNR